MRSLLLGLSLIATPSLAQPYGFGPPGLPAGTSFSGAQIGNYRSPRAPLAVPDAPVFGDTPVERAFGRDVDDSFTRPRVPRPDADGAQTRLRAAEGRSTIRPDTAGDFARSDPSVLNQSGATRPISPPRRARIVPNTQPSR